jgi:hypothetical protein
VLRRVSSVTVICVAGSASGHRADAAPAGSPVQRMILGTNLAAWRDLSYKECFFVNFVAPGALD